MIYTLTFNPALDYAVYVPDYTTGKTNRSSREQLDFGGKGINVSYVLHQLGEPTVALGFVAGFTGQALCEMLERTGVSCDFVKLKSGLTRINVKIKCDDETEINAAGPEISADALEELYAKLDRISEGDVLLLSGSVPSSLPRNIYETILSRLQGRGIHFAIDAEGQLLLNVLKYRPLLIKPNRAELCGLAGRELTSDVDVESAARELQVLGARNVLVSLGGDGALLLDEQGSVHRACAVGGKPINTVGAGDSMVAGFLSGLGRGYDYALRLGLAAGGATACSPYLATREEIEQLMK
ncbi:MAG: 1-phosphofructokinase [Ruminococcaceae bacterium]|nr:1-phosphofructokinase [Oscillospiraceae bacterium]